MLKLATSLAAGSDADLVPNRGILTLAVYAVDREAWDTRQAPSCRPLFRGLFGRSSAVEQSAVNRLVVGSNPTARAIFSIS